MEFIIAGESRGSKERMIKLKEAGLELASFQLHVCQLLLSVGDKN